MRRVLFVSAASRLGGAERSLLELARELDRGRFEPSAVVGGPGPVADAFCASGMEVDVIEMERLRRTLNPLKLAGYMAGVSKASRRIADVIRGRKIDLVHSNGAVAQIYAGGAARRAGVPCVWHARDMVSLGPLGRSLSGRAARVIAVSEAVRDHVVRAGAKPSRVRVVRNGLDLSAFAESGSRERTLREETRRELGIDERAFVAGTAGVFVPWKRHEDFIRAFARLCEMELAESSPSARGAGGAAMVPARAVIAGADLFGEHGRYASELSRLADELTGSRIVFTGWREDMPRLLAALDVFVSGSENEPFGRVLVEAMAAGLAVVATDSGGRREIVEDGKTGILVPQGDIDALALALDGLRREPERRARLGREGRRVATRAFTVERCAREVEAVYEEAAR